MDQDIAQVVEHKPNIFKVLSSIFSTMPLITPKYGSLSQKRKNYDTV